MRAMYLWKSSGYYVCLISVFSISLFSVYRSYTFCQICFVMTRSGTQGPGANQPLPWSCANTAKYLWRCY